MFVMRRKATNNQSIVQIHTQFKIPNRENDATAEKQIGRECCYLKIKDYKDIANKEFLYWNTGADTMQLELSC